MKTQLLPSLRVLSALLPGLAFAVCLHASTPEVLFSISTIDQPVAPSRSLAVSLAAMNPSASAGEVVWPRTVPGVLVVANTRLDVQLEQDRSETATMQLAPHQFTIREYTVAIPSGAPAGAGFLEVKLSGTAPIRVGLIVEGNTQPPQSSITAAAEQPTSSLVHSEPALNALNRSFADRIAPHEPIYFIYGPDDPAAKFQLSLKYKMLDFGNLSRKWASRSIQFGYTQRSLWDISADSSPFYDTSYMPEIFFEALSPVSERKGNVNWLGFQAGYQHESNGRDGLLSRSLDLVKVRAAVAFGDLDGWHAIVIPSLWTYMGESEYNDDIDDYRGYGQLRVIVGRNDGPTLSMSTWAGKDFDHASVQLDLNMPIRLNLLDLKTYVIVQYFNGYGEGLREYNKKSDTIRAGMAIVR